MQVQPLGLAPEEAGVSDGAPPPRSWLFVPADSNKKIMRALESDADAIIFDLEDSVAPACKPLAREILGLLPARRDGERRVRRDPQVVPLVGADLRDQAAALFQDA